MRPRLGLAIADRALCSVASLSRWTHQVGERRHVRRSTPTWNAIELSSPVVFADRWEMGELSSWHSNPPPSCVTKACRTAFVTGGGGREWLGGSPNRRL